AAVRVQVFGEPLETRCLSLVQGAIAFRVVAYQYFTESGLERLDVLGEVLPVLEVEFVLAALLGRAGGGVAVRRRVVKNGGTELLVDEDPRLLLGNAGLECSLKTIVDDFFGGSDLCRLSRAERATPSEHLGLERSAVVEGQNV